MTELYINDNRADLMESISISLNYSIADVRNPDKRNAGYSKTITLPGTKNNNIIFDHIYELSKSTLTVDFNPAKREKARLIVNSDTLIDGYLRLLKVNNVDGAVTYEVCIYDNVADLFKVVGDDTINQIDSSTLVVPWTKTTIVNSWNRLLATERYCFPMIDYGTKASHNDWKIEDFLPAIQVKFIWDKIFEKYGFRYASTYLGSPEFRRLYLLGSSNAPVISQSQIDYRKVVADKTGHPFTLPLLTWETLDFENITQNDAGYLLAGGIEYVTPVRAYHDIVITVEATADRASVNPVPTSLWQQSRIITRAIINKARVEANKNATSLYGSSYIRIPAGSNSVSFSYQYTFENVDIKALGVSAPTWFNIVRTRGAYEGQTGTTSPYNDIEITIDNVYLSITQRSRQTVEGEDIDMAQYIPNMKVKDFLKSVIQMHNLYIDPRTDTGAMIVEPRDNYYALGSKKDWTFKLDRSSNIEIQPLAELSFKSIKATYLKDVDYLNQLYSKESSEVYGQEVREIDNDFVNDSIEIKPMFAPTIIQDRFNTGRPLPSIYKYDENTGVVESLTGFKPRVLILGNVFFTSPYEFSGSTSVYLSAGMAGSDNKGPNESIEFGVPVQLFHNVTAWTNNNLFNRFYSKFVQTIASPDSAIVTGKFYLTLDDMVNFSFYDTIQIDGVDFYVNKINNFDPVNESLTDVELIRVVYDVPDFVGGEVILPPYIPQDEEFDLIIGGIDSIFVADSFGYEVLNGGVDDTMTNTTEFIIYG